MDSPASYTKRMEGDAAVFQVQPAAYPKFWLLVGAGGAAGLIGLASGSVFMWVVAALGLWFGLKDPRPPEHASAATFRVTPDAIVVGTRTIPRAEIQDLAVNTGLLAKPGGIPNVGAMVSPSQKAKAEQAAQCVDVCCDGKYITLAGGLDAGTASSLRSEVAQLIGTLGQTKAGDLTLGQPKSGDLLMNEIEDGVYQIERYTESGTERVIPVPFPDDLQKTIRFSLLYAGERTLWFMKMAGRRRGEPPVVIPPSILESPGFKGE